PDGGKGSDFFTKSRHFDDKNRPRVGHLLIRSYDEGEPPRRWDRNLQPLRHREGMGKNRRSYRRGCERRFAFWCLKDVSGCSLVHWSRAFLSLPGSNSLLQF